MKKSFYGVFVSLLFLLFSVNGSIYSEADTAPCLFSNIEVNGSASEVLVPLMEERLVLMVNETRRKLGSFQICAPCTCCGGPKGLCLPSPCCYAINCNIPNRPFGFCSFTPKTCNCFGCHY